MAAIFLPGPFAEEDMLRAILGPEGAALPRAAATLPGYGIFADPNGARLALAADPAAVAPGVV
nr:hypothetical protein [Paracoccaceae bacterium]